MRNIKITVLTGVLAVSLLAPTCVNAESGTSVVEGENILLSSESAPFAPGIEDIGYTSTPTQLHLIVANSEGSLEKVTTATWISSNPQVASVSTNGVLTFAGINGTTTIKANYNGVTYTKNIIVNPRDIQKLQRVYVPESLEYNKSITVLSLRGVYADGEFLIKDNITWHTSNSSVATIDKDGVLTFTGLNGTVTLSANYRGFIFEKSIVVSNREPLYVRIQGQQTYYEKPLNLSLIGYYPDGSSGAISDKVKWSVDKTSVASVDQYGVVSFKQLAGSVLVTATYMGHSHSVNVVRNNTAYSSVYTKGNLAYSPVGNQLFLVGKHLNGYEEYIHNNVIWTSSDNNIAQVSGGYVVYTGKPGPFLITAKYGGKDYVFSGTVASNYLSSFVIKQQKMHENTVQLTLTDTSDKSQISENNILWSSNNSNIAAVNGKGVVTLGQVKGEVTINARYQGVDTSTVVINEGHTDVSQSMDSSIFAKSIDRDIILENLKMKSNQFTKNKITDVVGHWAESDVKLAERLGIITGYRNGTFKPQNLVTRAEFAVILDHLLGERANSASAEFKDTRSHWATQSINNIYALGLMQGDTQGKFDPNKNITRAEVAMVMSRILDTSKLQNTYMSSFLDTNNHWAKEAIKSLSGAGILQGKNRSFGPNEYTTRAETISILLRSLRLDPQIQSVLK